MKQFKKQQKKPTSGVPIMQTCIDTTQIEQMRVGVYENTDVFTAEVIFDFATAQSGWGGENQVKLRNNLHKINNIAYKQPAQLTFANEWYQHAVKRSKEFGKYTNSNLHTKLGYRFEQRYHTIPYTYFSYDPVTKSFLLQVSIPDNDENEFKHHMELEGDLTLTGKRNLVYDWFS